ncbi:hypothetical protein [Sulfitobacter sp. R18_1]|uniref:hypothetical protein n=1 Tax=Sulfitobacter sp. R18_1 TaxID=2821104 RepID=UPI001ADC0BA5|nr:hypothetical protein [Sulfitobacter sp. R18_1]MBO9428184.1 hypothetical protein [Sulfitobacter sp. R18_1]
MATNYTQFCVSLPEGKEISDAANNIVCDVENYFDGEDHSLSEELLGALENSAIQDELGFQVDFEGPDGSQVVVFSDENASIEVAATMISDILEAANSDEVIILDYALTSSRFQIGAYGGGSVAISRKDIQYFDPTSMAQKAAEEMKANLAGAPAP